MRKAAPTRTRGETYANTTPCAQAPACTTPGRATATRSLAPTPVGLARGRRPGYLVATRPPRWRALTRSRFQRVASCALPHAPPATARRLHMVTSTHAGGGQAQRHCHAAVARRSNSRFDRSLAPAGRRPRSRLNIATSVCLSCTAPRHRYLSCITYNSSIASDATPAAFKTSLAVCDRLRFTESSLCAERRRGKLRGRRDRGRVRQVHRADGRPVPAV